MFTTYRDTEMVIEGFDDHHRSQLWWCVEQELIHPWFYLQLSHRSGSEISTSMMMVHHAHELREFVNSQSKRTWLDQVMLITPPHTNGKAQWLMERLEKIVVFSSPLRTEFELQYEVSGGEKYYLNGACNLQNFSESLTLFDSDNDLTRGK